MAEHNEWRLVGLDIIIDERIDQGGGIGALLSGNRRGKAEPRLLEDEAGQFQAQSREVLATGLEAETFTVKRAEVVDGARIFVVTRDDGRDELTPLACNADVLCAGVIVVTFDALSDALAPLADAFRDAIERLLARLRLVTDNEFTFANVRIAL